MSNIIHNLKVAMRNLLKYKLQTVISVLCIAIGIVTLSFAHSALMFYRLPALYDEPYCDRAYKVSFKPTQEKRDVKIGNDLLRAVKRDGGLRNAEKIAMPNGYSLGLMAEFHLADSTVRKGLTNANYIDPEYADYAGFRSAVTGKKIKKLKRGEAIISENHARKIFQDKNPIGAVQSNISDGQPIPVTIVDVYQTLSSLEQPIQNDMLYYCVDDSIESQLFDDTKYYAVWLNVVLREGSTERQLLQEINGRVKPLGLEAELKKAMSEDETSTVISIRLLVYTISSLILLAAIIGFLRIQTQLFWLRRREMSLRIVNGATRMKLFGLLVTEVVITICLAVMTAVWLGYLLEDFFATDKSLLISELELDLSSLWLYSLVIGGGLLAIGCLLVWITLVRICKAGEGLAANMRRSRSHLFRNAMLGIQIAISLVFVCGTFILTNGVDKVLKAHHIPENDNLYKECILLRPIYAEQPQRLLDEIKRLPDLDKMIMCSTAYTYIREVAESSSQEVKDKLKNQYFQTYFATDTTMLSFLGMDVEWLNRDIDRNECVLICENRYRQFRELGLLDKNTLDFYNIWDNQPYQFPIGGIIKSIPYDARGNSFVLISSNHDKGRSDYILVPKAGRGKALARSVNETIERLEPAIINKMVFNFREQTCLTAGMVEAARAGGWILGGVSLLICIMSIFSTIALDTRARRKEVAIRKVNGAKGKDIYRMFGRVYALLIVTALFVAVPLCVLFNGMVETYIKELSPEMTLSPGVPIILGMLGIAVVTLLILLIVGWQIRTVMQVDPAKIIAKE